MDKDFIEHLDAQSTLAELPWYDAQMELSTLGRVLDDLLRDRTDLPGVVVTENGHIRGVLSRGQYLRQIGRHLGRELFGGRPIELIYRAVEQTEKPLIVPLTTPVQEAVRRALERPEKLIYEPLIAEGPDGSPRLIDFPDLLRADSRISALRNEQMRQILATVREGFLLVDRDYQIAAEHSSFVEKIFPTTHIAGRRFDDLLAEFLKKDKAELGRDYLGTLFNPNVIESLVADINPLRQVELPGEDKHLAFRFLRGVEGQEIRRVLVQVQDVTRQVKLAEELEDQEKRAQEKVALVLEIVQTDPEGLTSFLASFDRELEYSQEVLAAASPETQLQAAVEDLMRRMHALKGEAGLLKLRRFERRIHKLEDRLTALHERDALAVEDLRKTGPGLADLATLADETRSIIEQFARVSASTSLTTAGLFDSIQELTASLGERHGKPARFVSRNDEAQIPAEYRGLTRKLLIQLARNSVVHGLEEPELRNARGKPPLGTLQFAVRRHPPTTEQPRGQLELVFQDDGGGLDLDKLRRKAQELGRPANSDNELRQLIFESGFSTADETTRDAGRGVGMDIIKDEVERSGGSIQPHSQAGAFCAFQIVLPL